MKYRHYAPKTPVFVVEGTVEAFEEAIHKYKVQGKTVVYGLKALL